MSSRFKVLKFGNEIKYKDSKDAVRNYIRPDYHFPFIFEKLLFSSIEHAFTYFVLMEDQKYPDPEYLLILLLRQRYTEDKTFSKILDQAAKDNIEFFHMCNDNDEYSGCADIFSRISNFGTIMTKVSRYINNNSDDSSDSSDSDDSSDEVFSDSGSGSGSGSETEEYEPDDVSLNSIIIDDYEFTLLFQFTKSSRKHVRIKSQHVESEETTFFIVYQSYSQGGTWRLAMKMSDGDSNIYYKGLDYATSTFIHMDLMCLISNNISSLSEVNDSIQIPCVMDTKIFRDYNKMFHVPEFTELQKIRCGEFSQTDFEDIEIRGINLVQEQKTTQQKLTKTSQIMSNYIKSNFIHILNKTETETKTKTETETKKICTTVFDMYGLPLKFSYLETHIQSKKSSQVFTLIFARYKTLDPNSKFKDVYTIPLNIIPLEQKITKHGLYEKFTSAGMYLCKPFEYTFQCRLDNDSKEDDCTLRSIGPYYFIGDLMTGMWPTMNHKP